MSTRHYFLTPDGHTGWRESPEDFPPEAITIDEEQHNTITTSILGGMRVRIVGNEIIIDDLPPEEPIETNPDNPLEKELTKRQIVSALILGAQIIDPDTFIEDAISSIPNPLERALALNDWRNAPYYVREHPLFNDVDMLTATGLDPRDIDNLWILASQQQR